MIQTFANSFLYTVLIGVKLYRIHKAFARMRATADSVSLHLIVRVSIFSVYSFLAIVYELFFKEF